VPHRCLSLAHTAVSDSRIFVAGRHRCLGRVETAVSDSRIFVAGRHRCLGRVETTVSDSRGLAGPPHEPGGGAVGPDPTPASLAESGYSS
jgi:hypothetical protein